MGSSRKLTLMNIALFLFGCILVWMRSINLPLMGPLLWEDGPFENTQAVLYFLASMGFILICLRSSKNLWHLGLALLFFVLAGEEISWGQRIFDIAAPAWEMKNNVQGETNIHNIGGIHQHVRMVGALFCGFYFILLPILSRYFVKVRGFVAKLKIPVYPIWGQLVMIIGILVMVYDRRILHRTDTLMTEIAETFIAMGTYFFFLSEYWLTSDSKHKNISAFVYLFSFICIVLGLYFGTLFMLKHMAA